ncbi:MULTISPECIES: phosphonate ABC transporter ATP-binding protein [Virgibacillus]|uniref:Phosphonates import ATP-binding protein PhnC n=1 Tax=Virgibacillus oceani TaxID=1479511 RepID=A0A917HFR9_9BACI|nr:MULTISPECIES: phosphonate ABC transporter ATP-binding protein [Virgibacillus]GGG77277.1 phosphonates import ATP-binding protein PhnC [Virgibacillus oceani]
MLKVNNISVRYPGGERDALSNVNVSLIEGDFVCILGKSGSGKSTFIRCINGLQKTTRGEVLWNNTSLSTLADKQLMTVRREIGMIFQHFNLIPRLTVFQNVLTGTFGYRSTFKNLVGWFSREEIKRAKQIIADVELTDQINRRVEQLSGGQKQRVGIARAMLQNPKVFLGDEPVSSLDPGTSNRIFTLLQKMHNRHNLLTIINVHNVELAKLFATRIIALKDGEVIFDGLPEAFTEQEFHQTYHSTSVKTKVL